MFGHRGFSGLAATLLPLFLLGGCVGNRPYRVSSGDLTAGLPANILPVNTQVPPIHFVEFDDQGELWTPCTTVDQMDSCQLARAVTAIKQNTSKNPIIVTFVHGWRNNADQLFDPNKNVAGFQRFLVQLQNRNLNRPVIGVYVAWRGKSIKDPIFFFSFYQRRRAAEHVSGVAFTEALYDLMLATRTAKDINTGCISPRKADSARVFGQRYEASKQMKLADKPLFILVAHSFGGYIAERALNQSFVSRFLELDNTPDHGACELPTAVPDLIVYVNSAGEAAQTKQMIEVLKHLRGKPAAGQTPTYPLFIAVSSEKDQATNVLMPLGQVPAATTRAWRKQTDYPGQPGTAYHTSPNMPKQSIFYTHTAAHIEFLQNHCLFKAHEARNCGLGAVEVLTFATTTGDYTLWQRTQFSYSKTVSSTPTWNDTPYWVMTVPDTVIHQHSGIFREEFQNFLLATIANFK